MARTPAGTLPQLRLHRRTGQAVVTLTNPRGSRRDYYLGKPGAAAQARYRGLLADWIRADKEFPAFKDGEPNDEPRTITDLVARFEAHAKAYYKRLDGTHTGEHLSIQRACSFLTEAHGSLHPVELGPKKLGELRDALVKRHFRCEKDPLGREKDGTGKTLSRNYINSVIRRIKQMFKWAEANELVPATTYHRLATVEGLKSGRSDVRETKGLQPVTEQQVRATVPGLSRQVAALVWFCWYTGARMGEAVQLATRHVNMRKSPWIFRPPQHKNLFRGKDRVIPIGKEAQAVLRPFLQVVPDRLWFRPCDALQERNAARLPDLPSERMKTRLARIARRRREDPKWTPGEAYSTNAVQIAIRRACDAAGVEPWTPHMLRHAALSRIREQRGLEAAAAIGGHWQLDVTQAYTKAAQAKLAIEVMRDLG